MIEMPSGEVVSVFAMYDEAGKEVADRNQARQFGVQREDGSCALLRPPTPPPRLRAGEGHKAIML